MEFSNKNIGNYKFNKYVIFGCIIIIAFLILLNYNKGNDVFINKKNSYVNVFSFI